MSNHDFEKIALSYFSKSQHITNSKNIYLKPNIPQKKINGAMSVYERWINEDDIILLVDDTIFGGAKEGIILTPEIFASKQISEDPNLILLENIYEIKSEKKKIYINDDIFTSLSCIDTKEIKELADILAQLFSLTYEDKDNESDSEELPEASDQQSASITVTHASNKSESDLYSFIIERIGKFSTAVLENEETLNLMSEKIHGILPGIMKPLVTTNIIKSFIIENKEKLTFQAFDSTNTQEQSNHSLPKNTAPLSNNDQERPLTIAKRSVAKEIHNEIREILDECDSADFDSMKKNEIIAVMSTSFACAVIESSLSFQEFVIEKSKELGFEKKAVSKAFDADSTSIAMLTYIASYIYFILKTEADYAFEDAQKYFSIPYGLIHRIILDKKPDSLGSIANPSKAARETSEFKNSDSNFGKFFQLQRFDANMAPSFMFLVSSLSLDGWDENDLKLFQSMRSTTSFINEVDQFLIKTEEEIKSMLIEFINTCRKIGQLPIVNSQVNIPSSLFFSEKNEGIIKRART